MVGTLFFFSLVNRTALGDTASFSANPSLAANPKPLDAIEFRLMTFSPYDDIFAWFGHVAIEVRNTITGKSITYSFGGFSFGMEELLQYTLGRFVFWSYFDHTEGYLHHYEKEKRHIIFQTLDLTQDQKIKLGNLLVLHTSSKNSHYLYDHFRNNCATRIRDIVNETVDGALKTQTSVPTAQTYRDYVRRMMSHLPLISFIIHLFMNDNLDKPVTKWESMFLPDRLMVEFQGSYRPGQPEKARRTLVGKRTEKIGGKRTPYFDRAVRIPDTQQREYAYGTCLLLLFGLAAVRYRQETGFGRLFYPGLISLYGLFLGGLGLILFLVANFTDHRDVYANENLFLLNPMTFALLPLGMLRVFGKGRDVFAVTSILCGMVALAGIGLKILPVFDQSNGQTIRILLPAILLVAVTGLLDFKDDAGSKPQASVSKI